MKPGDEYWFVPSCRSRDPHPINIVSVGRKWANFSRFRDSSHRPCGRIDMVTLWADGGNYTSPGRAYACKEDHDKVIRTQKKLAKLKEFFSSLSYQREELPEEMIDAIMKAAGISELKEEQK